MKNGNRPPRMGGAAQLQAMAQQAVPIQPQAEAPARSMSDPVAPHPFDGIRVLGHWLMAEIVKGEETTTSGNIVVPESAQRPVLRVHAVGPDVVGVSVGDFILPAVNPGVTVLESRSFMTLCQGKEPPHQQVAAVLDPANAQMRMNAKPPKPLVELAS